MFALYASIVFTLRSTASGCKSVCRKSSRSMVPPLTTTTTTTSTTTLLATIYNCMCVYVGLLLLLLLPPSACRNSLAPANTLRATFMLLLLHIPNKYELVPFPKSPLKYEYIHFCECVFFVVLSARIYNHFNQQATIRHHLQTHLH